MTMFAEPQHPRLVTLYDRVKVRPRIAAYLSSPRRLAFNEQGIFATIPSWKKNRRKRAKKRRTERGVRSLSRF
jgi:Glutathione S-transferase, C-terminal domain